MKKAVYRKCYVKRSRRLFKIMTFREYAYSKTALIREEYLLQNVNFTSRKNFFQHNL